VRGKVSILRLRTLQSREPKEPAFWRIRRFPYGRLVERVIDPDVHLLEYTMYNPFKVQNPLVINTLYGPEYDPGEEPPSNSLPRPGGTITDQGHLV
jgi:hypothetical protein